MAGYRNGNGKKRRGIGTGTFGPPAPNPLIPNEIPSEFELGDDWQSEDPGPGPGECPEGFQQITVPGPFGVGGGSQCVPIDPGEEEEPEDPNPFTRVRPSGGGSLRKRPRRNPFRG